MQYVPNLRVIAGFVVAPVIPGLLISISDFFRGDVGMALWYVQFSAAAGYPTALVFGLPLHIWFCKRHWTSYPLYAGSGLILGACVYLSAYLAGLFVDPIAVVAAMKKSLIFMFLSAIAGGVAASVFWLIALKRYR